MITLGFIPYVHTSDLERVWVFHLSVTEPGQVNGVAEGRYRVQFTLEFILKGS